MMNKEDVQFLNQLVKSLDDAGKKLEESYMKLNYEKFNQSKKIILQIQKEILEMIK